MVCIDLRCGGAPDEWLKGRDERNLSVGKVKAATHVGHNSVTFEVWWSVVLSSCR